MQIVLSSPSLSPLLYQISSCWPMDALLTSGVSIVKARQRHKRSKTARRGRRPPGDLVVKHRNRGTSTAQLPGKAGETHPIRQPCRNAHPIKNFRSKAQRHKHKQNTQERRNPPRQAALRQCPSFGPCPSFAQCLGLQSSSWQSRGGACLP